MGAQAGDDERSRGIPVRLRQGLKVLFDAAQHAQAAAADPWAFAVDYRQLSELGLTANDVQLLVRMKLVEHVGQVTVAGQNIRSAHSAGDLLVSRQTSFVLTRRGVALLCRGCLTDTPHTPS